MGQERCFHNDQRAEMKRKLRQVDNLWFSHVWKQEVKSPQCRNLEQEIGEQEQAAESSSVKYTKCSYVCHSFLVDRNIGCQLYLYCIVTGKQSLYVIKTQKHFSIFLTLLTIAFVSFKSLTFHWPFLRCRCCLWLRIMLYLFSYLSVLSLTVLSLSHH